jgi:flagellar protein FliO/FliZ
LCAVINQPVYSQTGSETASGEAAVDSDAQAEGGVEADNSLRDAERNLLIADDSPLNVGPGGSSAFAILRILIVLVFVAAAIYGLVFFIKRSKNPLLAEDAHLKVLANVPINAKTSAAVIAVGREAFLVGLSETAVTLISKIGDQETIDAMILEASRKSAAGVGKALSFKDILAKLAAAKPASTVKSAGEDNDSALTESLRQKRDNLKKL